MINIQDFPGYTFNLTTGEVVQRFGVGRAAGQPVAVRRRPGCAPSCRLKSADGRLRTFRVDAIKEIPGDGWAVAHPEGTTTLGMFPNYAFSPDGQVWKVTGARVPLLEPRPVQWIPTQEGPACVLVTDNGEQPFITRKSIVTHLSQS